MADGARVASAGQAGPGQVALNYMLLDAVSATTNGTWTGVKNYRHFTIEVQGIVAGDIVTIYTAVDDGNGVPANTAHRAALPTTITADGLTVMTGRPDWVKARLTAHAGDGDVTVVIKCSY